MSERLSDPGLSDPGAGPAPPATGGREAINAAAGTGSCYDSDPCGPAPWGGPNAVIGGRLPR